ncbi:MAG: superoxide dismutase [Verrucomicrobia bacterium]|nr:superoxide dismutase [Verrucomicrobiota bacterium]
MAYTLPQLDYAYNALEPHIDARTMEIHHSKHHNTYITNVNKALADAGVQAPECVLDLISKIDSLPEGVQTAVRNNGGGHANHSLFWKVIGPNAGGAPTGVLADKINATFGDFENFKKEFGAAATTRFGSGWAWLIAYKDGSLRIASTPNQDSPLMGKIYGYCGGTPILGLDVWEHAYYLNYQNRRPDYIAAFWNVVNWSKVSELYGKASS